MGLFPLPSGRVHRTHPILLTCGLVIGFLILWCSRAVLYDTWTLAALPLVWSHNSERFVISAAADGFDVAFTNYSRQQLSAAPYEDKIPPILHHLDFGSGASAHSRWKDARQSCLDMHPGWDAYLWTDETGDAFVAEHFPELHHMWKTYQYPIQRIDALRYMVLYHYGGVILDLDLQCKRALGPLRRFDFVAPAAHPQGFSIGFMMASKQNEFVGKLVSNLMRYNRHWLGLPYPTVMFSTGCHFASTIHSLQRDRSEFKILSGPQDNAKMHRLNGHVSTPLFNHLGSSSWHSYDAAMIVSLGRFRRWRATVFFISGVCIAVFLMRKTKRRYFIKG